MGQNLPFKRVYFDRIFHRSYWTWRKHPTIIIPTMLGSALTTIEESTITMAAIIYLTVLASRNLLAGFLNEYFKAGGILAILGDPTFSLEFISLFVAVVIVLFLIGILGGGFVLSAEYGTYLEAWTKNSVSVGGMLENGRRSWKRMAWTLLLTNIVTWGPAVIGSLLLLLSLQNLTSISDIRFTLYASIAGLLIILSLVLSIFTLYTFPVVTVDQTSGLKALRRSFSFALHNLGITITYGLVKAIFQVLSIFIILTGAFIGLPMSSLAMVMLSLVVTPILHSTKTMIYSYGRPAEPEMPFELAEPILDDIRFRLPRVAWRKVRMGLSEISSFLFSIGNLPFHIASILAFGLGIALGDYVSANGLVGFLGIQPGTINPAIEQVFGPALGFDIFLNNWLVSIATGLAGIGFGLPTFQTILFNGFILGALLPAFQNLTLFLAGILPHGIIEIPSFVLSGSVGIKLGFAALKTRFQPGPESQESLSSTLRQAVYIVVGLAPLFLVAGLIEGNLTPIIMRFFGWTG